MLKHEFFHRPPCQAVAPGTSDVARLDTVPCPGPSQRVVAVVVTHDRPALLHRCLNALTGQRRPADAVVVVDNASGPATATVLAGFPGVTVLRQARNLGGADGYHAGIMATLRDGADWVWLMDDDGRPHDGGCLLGLLAAAHRTGADMAAPLVVDVDRPTHLAFPLRHRRRTCFAVAEVAEAGDLTGFAHLFNGVLVSAALFFRIGLPDRRFVMRGDEVEFLLRARHAGARITLATSVHFLHPGGSAEIHPILAGLYYATLPGDPAKQFLQFRNRAWIFRRYRMWAWLAADVARYGCFFLATRRDTRGFGRWAMASWDGFRGTFMRDPPDAAEARVETLLAGE